MDCSCIKKNYNFQLEALDAKTLLYQDFSDWMTEDYYVKPDSYKIEVKTPNRSEYVEITVNSTSFSVLTSKELNIASKCLPSGVYAFKTTSCGNTYIRYKAVTADLDCRLQCLILDEKHRYKAFKLKADVASIHANIEKDKPIEATKIYKTVKKEIDKLECHCECCS